jgi:prevent-host-death family protein
MEYLLDMAISRSAADESPVVGAFEAKTHLAKLLDRVSHGEIITITRNGVPVARLVPVTDEAASLVREDLGSRFRTFQQAHPLKGLRSKDLVDEGRKR